MVNNTVKYILTLAANKHKPGGVEHDQSRHAGSRGSSSDGKYGIARGSTPAIRAQTRRDVVDTLRRKFGSGAMEDNPTAAYRGVKDDTSVTLNGRRLGFKRESDVERGLGEIGYKKNNTGAWQTSARDHAILIRSVGTTDGTVNVSVVT